MLRITVLRVRVFFAVLGCGILAASLLDWAQTLRATESGFRWVRSETSAAPAAETAEIWRTSARCMRPFFVDAVLRSKTKLKAYYDLVPAEVRASRTPPAFAARAPAPAVPTGGYRLIADRPSQTPAQLERGAMLHARYAEWYANVFKFEVEEHQWEERLDNLADQSVTVGEAARKSFAAGHGVARANAADDFDANLLSLLGVGGFPNEEEQALRARCVSIVPVKKVLNSPHYLSEFWRWPVDYAAAFSFGLELLLIAVFFVPIDLWLGTGDVRAARQYLAAVTARRAAAMRRHGGKVLALILNAVLGALRATARGACAIFTAGIGSGAAVGQIHFVAKLAQVRTQQGRLRPLRIAQALAPIDGNTLPGRTVEWLQHAGANRFDDRLA